MLALLLLCSSLMTTPPPSPGAADGVPLHLEGDGDGFVLVVAEPAPSVQVQWQDDHAIGRFYGGGGRALEAAACGTDVVTRTLLPGRYRADTAALFFQEPLMPGAYTFVVPAVVDGADVAVSLSIRVEAPRAEDVQLVLRALDGGSRCPPAAAAVTAFKRIGNPTTAARLLTLPGLHRAWRRDLARRFLLADATQAELEVLLAPLLADPSAHVATDAALLLAFAHDEGVRARARAQLRAVTGTDDRDAAEAHENRRTPESAQPCAAAPADAAGLAALLARPRFVVEGAVAAGPRPRTSSHARARGTMLQPRV